MEGDDAPKTLLIGGGVYLASGVIGFLASILSIIPIVGLVLGPLGALVAVVPSLLVGGYSVSVCRSVMEGRDEPPTFDDWGRLLRDGLKVAVIGLLYALPVALLGAVALVLFLVVSFIFGSYSDVTSIASLLITTLGSLVAAVYFLAVAYVMPAAIFGYARSESISAAWDVGTLRTIATDVQYAKAWAVGFLFLFVANIVGSSLTLLLVGFLVFFYGQVAAMYLYANGAMDALEMPRSGQTGEGGTGQRGEPTDGTGADDHTEPDADDHTEPDADDHTEPDADDDSGFDIDDDTGSAGDEDSGFDIDEGAGEDGAADRGLEDVTGIGPTTADSLRTAGYESVADLQEASRSDLADIEGIGPAKADRIKDDVDAE